MYRIPHPHPGPKRGKAVGATRAWFRLRKTTVMQDGQRYLDRRATPKHTAFLSVCHLSAQVLLGCRGVSPSFPCSLWRKPPVYARTWTLISWKPLGIAAMELLSRAAWQYSTLLWVWRCGGRMGMEEWRGEERRGLVFSFDCSSATTRFLQEHICSPSTLCDPEL